ncbi:hypothetical protein SAMD00079811_06270 [Scytonema sp. HK-05]|uniref:hypothetical protein n=1 Tax=Scytonema sp. HK-05 TaxID=1137095 RepID=UPI000937CF4F|nr:hypothetical protein [Scytonema sp. HK-05]OKH59873.1 hypothetical protein NIES2130_06835 [Scytonema sp. HK-05]BAY43049.1 hypothetical protein SAMD00079811_06270 [Scytonema sp. HK-05]
MRKNIHKTVAVFAVIAALTSGCRSSEEYKKLTQAGNQYAHAVNELLTAASEIRIEATSEKLLQDDRILNQNENDYRTISKDDEEKLTIINDIRSHNQLLQNYFSKLQDLATSDAPDKAKTEIDGIAGNLNSVSKKLQGSDLITNKSLLQGVTNLVINSQIRGALREELEKRHEVILKELTIQQEVLNTLSDSMKKDVKSIQSAQEIRLVIRPLIQPKPIKNEDEWVQSRKKILLMDRKIEEIKNASNALGEFKEIYQASVEGKLTLARLNNHLQDIDSFLALVQNTK